MKITFEFEADEKENFSRILHADDAYGALWDISQFLRNEYKNNDKAPVEYLEKLRDSFSGILEEHGINLDRDYT